MAGAFFQDKENSFMELRRTTQPGYKQMKALISQLLSSTSRQLGHADKGRIDIGSDTRVAAVHIMSFSCGCCERRLCQTKWSVVMCLILCGNVV